MSLPPYFGGSASNLGIVRALTPQTFDAFVKETLGNPAIVKNVTRREFLARSKEERDKLKRVSFFTPSVHRGSPTRRAVETATYCNLICLDIDVEKDGTAPAAPLIENKGQALKDALHPFAFAAYTTAASTPEKPRLRVVVKADRIPLEVYPQAVQYVGAELLRLPVVTPESRVAVQPMFLPTLFCDDDPVYNHPLVVAVPEGAAVTVQTVAGAAAPSVRPAGEDDDAEDASLESLAFLRPQVDGVRLEDAESALEVLDPDCSYQEWIAVAAGLKHQFGDDAFDLFLEWSSRGEKYTTEEDTRTKWDSFKANPKGRLPVTIRSVMKKAAEAGWNQTEAVGQRCYDETRGWLVSANSAKILMEQGIPRIAGTLFLSDLQRSALLSSLYDSLRRVGVTLTRTELKKAYYKFERHAAKATQQDRQLRTAAESEMPSWARGFVYVATQDQFYQRHTGRKFAPDVFDRYFSVQLMTNGDENSAAPAVRPRDFALNVLKCPRVDDFAYDPSQSEAIFAEGHKRLVNLYIPSHPEPRAEGAAEAGAVIVRHIEHLIREPEYRQLVLDFMAYQVQAPGHKVRWVPVIQGVQGCGKTALLEIMRSVLGREHVRQVGPESVMSQYNGWAFGAQFVGIEEIRVVGHNRHEVMNAIKPCITNDYITVNDKWVVPFQTRNFTNYMMFTNYHDALAVSREERRYFVLYSPLQTRTQVDQLGGAAYFTNLFDTIHNRASELRHFFETWEISDTFDPDAQAPITKYMEEMARIASSPLQSAVIELIHDNRHILVQPDVVSLSTLIGLLELSRLPPFTDQAVIGILRELGFLPYGRISIGGTQHSIYGSRSVTFQKDPRDLARDRHESSSILD